MFRIKKIKKIIKPSDLLKSEGSNINGPTCILVPNWCKNRLGKYYLYFAHHSGKNIRMSYSNDLYGKWKNLRGGVLDIENKIDAYGHIASPEVCIDKKKKTIYMYFHALSKLKGGEQWTYLAASKDGVNFEQLSNKPIAPFYMRIFKYSGFTYGMVKGGAIWKSRIDDNKFNFLTNPFNKIGEDEIWHNYNGAVRHVGLILKKETLHVFYSKIADSPERIMHTSINLAENEDKDWVVNKSIEITRPEKKYEGADLPMNNSSAGAAHYPENALRDPYVFLESGKYYLLYSVAGEQGIAISEFQNLPK